MKVLSLTFTFLLFTFFSNAQIIVDDNGDVGIGPKYETSSTSPEVLDIDGTVHITPTNSSGAAEGLDIEFGSVSAPNWMTKLNFDAENNSGLIGASNKRIYGLYSNIVNANSYITNSDLSIKENVRSLENATAKIMLINPVIYDLKSSYFDNSDSEMLDDLITDSRGTSGVIAQELQEIYPKLVHFDKNSELLGVNYQGLIPHMIKAIQEQQIVIDELKSKVDILELGK